MQFELEALPIVQDKKEIAFNYEALKVYVEERVAYYKKLAVTPDTVKDAKADKAKLNALKNSIEDERKRVKKAWSLPYTNFETKVKEIVALIDEPITFIDNQIKEIENEAKNAKLEEIKAIYAEEVANRNLIITIPFETIFDNRWLNVTYKLPEIQTDIKNILDRLSAGIEALQSLNSPYLIEEISRLLGTYDASTKMFDLPAVLRKTKELTELQKTIVFAKEISYNEIEDEMPYEKPQAIDFRVWVTDTQKTLLRKFFLDNHIKYGRVPKED